jgi:hypothetical protein
MADLDEDLKKQLQDLATVLNTFKSEAVQLRILDSLLDKLSLSDVTVKRPASRARI